MFYTPILNAAIGLFFIYFFISTACSAINEWIAGFLALRSKTLIQGITRLLQGDQNPRLVQDLLNHGLISGLSQSSAGPSYIPSRTFALALIDSIQKSAEQAGQAANDLRTAIVSLPEGQAKSALLALWDHSGADVEKFRSEISTWYDNTMDRISGTYRRWTQLILFTIAITISGFLNADSFMISKFLYHDPVLSAGIAAVVQEKAKQPSNAANVENEIAKLPLPLGWWVLEHRKGGDSAAHDNSSSQPDPRRFPLNTDGWDGWLVKIFGLFLTAALASLGAPFWFDALSSISNLRMAGPSPGKSTALS